MISSILNKKSGFREQIKNLTGIRPKHLSIYKTAFTHRNYGKKHQVKNNETLEFVGDSVLSTVISEILYHKYPNEQEGMLTEMRSKIVNRKSLNKVGSKMGLSEMIRVPKGQSIRDNSHIIGNVLEALIGAIFIDRGYNNAQKFIKNIIVENHINIDELVNKVYSHKNLILNWAAQNGKKLTFKDKVIDHPGQKRHYEVSILDEQNELLGKAKAHSKKEASQLAAKAGIELLEERGLLVD